MLYPHIGDGFVRVKIESVASKGFGGLSILAFLCQHSGAANVDRRWRWWIWTSSSNLTSGLMPKIIIATTLECVDKLLYRGRLLFEVFLPWGNEKRQL